MDEKRCAPRWNVALPVKYVDPKAHAEGACALQDISTSGARFTVTKKHRAGDLVEMMLELPGTCTPFCVEAQVVWQKRLEEFQEECKYLTGVAFRKIRDCDKKWLIEHINGNHPEEFRRHWWDGCK